MDTQPQLEEEKMSIQLGDIIKLIAPTDSLLNDRIYFVKYLDKTKLVLVEENGNETAISFNEAGKLDNESITSIELLSRADSASYAKQNNLGMGIWIDVYFEGEVPVVFTGQITNVEEDMIEIKTYPDNDVIFIDFGYKGLPPDLNIEKIVVREAPTGVVGAIVESPLLDKGKDAVEIEGALEIEGTVIDEDEGEGAFEDEVEGAKLPGKPFAQFRDLFITADQIKIGTELQSITQEVDVPESEQRYGIDKQTNDLLDELLTTIPNIKRTEAVLNNIHKMIERFKQLRTEFSTFDQQGNALMPAIKGANYKPLVETLEQFNQKLYWILPVIKNKRKLYDIDDAVYDTENTDVLSQTLAQTRIEEADIIDRYYGDKFPTEENKYAFLIKSLNPYLTPFTDPADTTDTIITTLVNANITAIIDNITHNLTHFYSSVATAGKDKEQLANVSQRRFVLQNYNLGMTNLEMNKIKGGNLLVKRNKLTENDKLSLKSFLMLPEVTVRFSRITMPSTNLLIKANLNQKYINYWQLLKRNTAVTTTIVDNLDTPIEYNSAEDSANAVPFLSDYKEFILDESISVPDKYKKYLENIVPKTRVLFDLVKPYISGKLSIYNVLSYLEPFMIYQKDISFKQYENMNEFIGEKILGFKKNYISTSKEFNTLNNYKGYEQGQGYGYMPNLIKLFESRQDLREKILSAYGMDLSLVNLTDGEFMKKINDTDAGRLYNNAIALMIVTVMGAGDGIANVLSIKNQYDKNKATIAEGAKGTNAEGAKGTNAEGAKGKGANPCEKYKVIAKHYIEFDELQEDNNIEIYFDKKYDTTYYDILKEYQFDPSMPQEERVLLLTKKLKEKNGLQENEARRDAQAMIMGKRLVEDGDYAIFEMKDPDGNIDFKYYIRTNGKWESDESIPRGLMTDSSKMFCNLNEKCIKVKSDCLAIEDGLGETALKNNSLKQMLDDIDPYSDIYKLAIAEDEFHFNDVLEANLKNTVNKIKEDYEYSEFRIGKLISIHLMKLFRYEEQKFKLGASAEENMSVISPYLKLRDVILGQGDFVKRQLDIMKFVGHFTREATIESSTNTTTSETTVEDSYWYYCIKTNTKLMPSFLVKIASAYINGENFSKVVDLICTDQGTISEDGNTWVDKHSGYVIRKIDLSTEEEYTEDGFKAKTRAVIEADLGEFILQAKSQQKTNESLDAKKVANIISTMAREMGITIDTQKEYIIRNVVDLQGTSIPSKEGYKKKFETAAARGKPISDYETAYNTSLILLTLCYYLVAIQISVPSVKTRKTFPGCIRSFNGFPMGKPEDLSSIVYVACVANKVKSAIEPWNAIQKMNAKGIALGMEHLINTYIIQSTDVIKEFEKKREYIASNPLLESGETEHSISKWINFLPPLISVKLTASVLQDVTDGFVKEFMTALRKGDARQHEMLNILRAKIITFSLGIVESIQKTVNKKAAIMTNSNGEPYLENACCDNGEIKTLLYFSNAQPDIITFNNTVVKLSNILNDIRQMQKAGMFYDPTDTKFKFPIISDEFSEEVIYKAFIVFCKYGTSFPISEELRSVCMEKPENFNETASLDENIRMLKREGHNYSMESLNQLLKIVNSNNIVKLNVHKNAVNSIKVMRDVLDSMERRDIASPPKNFRKHFLEVLDTFETGKLFEDTPELREFRKYLGKSNELMLEDIKNFIKTPLFGIKKPDITKFNECIEYIADFQETGDGMFIEREDETIYKFITYIKNTMRHLTREFPNIIINAVDNDSVTIPAHWKLSDNHNSDLKKIIKSHYTLLNEYYNDTDIKLVLEKFKRLSSDSKLLAKNTLFFAPIQVDVNKHMYSLFDRRLVVMLFKFYFYSVFIDIISLKDDDEILSSTIVTANASVSAGDNVSGDTENDLLSVDATTDRNNGMLDEVEIRLGNKLEISEKIAKLLINFSTIICNNKKVIDYNYKSLMDKVLITKEDEKNVITNRLKNLTNEQLEVEDIFKNLRLERWSKGLQKGLVTYEGKTYDDEREAMEKQSLNELSVGKNSVVTDMNRDIYMLDQAQEDADNADIEMEDNAITYLGEDAEYEDYDMDGDENF